MVWSLFPPKTTVPVLATKLVPDPTHEPEAEVLAEFSLRILDPPFNIPEVSVTVPSMVWVNPAPRLRTPPFPFIVSPVPFTLPVRVAAPEVFVIETAPRVVKPEIFWVEVVPVIATTEVPAVKVPPKLMKSPWKVKPKLFVTRVAPGSIDNGTLVLFPNCLGPFMIITPLLSISTPPEAINGEIHSKPAVRAVVALYCSVAPEP